MKVGGRWKIETNAEFLKVSQIIIHTVLANNFYQHKTILDNNTSVHLYLKGDCFFNSSMYLINTYNINRITVFPPSSECRIVFSTYL